LGKFKQKGPQVMASVKHSTGKSAPAFVLKLRPRPFAKREYTLRLIGQFTPSFCTEDNSNALVDTRSGLNTLLLVFAITKDLLFIIGLAVPNQQQQRQ